MHGKENRDPCIRCLDRCSWAYGVKQRTILYSNAEQANTAPLWVL